MIWEKLVEALNALEEEELLFVDVGCHKGHYWGKLQSHLKKPTFAIGIDPLDYSVQGGYNKFYNIAIDNVLKPTKALFREYNEPGCSSLLKMNVDDLSHDAKDYLKKWYVGYNIEDVIREFEVEVDSLYNLFKDDKSISFIKIDTQGNDINVVRSLRKLLRTTHYIQIESASKNNVLYHGQKTIDSDIERMRRMGFDVLEIIDYSKWAAVQESDVVFYNTRLHGKNSLSQS